MIPDLPLADLYIGPVAGTPTFAGVPYGTVATAQQFAPGTLDCTLTVAGDPTTVLFTGSVIVTAGETRTLVLTKAAGAVVSRTSVDNTRPISSEGQLQIINAAPSSTQPDMFLIAAGGTLAGATAKIVNQPLLSIAGAISAAGNYDVAFTATAIHYGHCRSGSAHDRERRYLHHLRDRCGRRRAAVSDRSHPVLTTDLSLPI